MAGTDSGGVNERLNGLVTLLQSVGIDGVDSDALLEQQKRQSNSKSKGNSSKNIPKKKASSTSDNTAMTMSNDAQILEIVKKLQQAQADSPEILEALKSPELLALASLAAQKQGLQARAPAPSKPAMPSLDDVMDDDDNYPKIGPGYSDDISVISELSTPTVMTRQHIADEEYYSEVRPGGQGVVPSVAGGLASGRLARNSRSAPNRAGLGIGKLGAGKTKNMVGQVRPLAARRAIPAIPAIPTKTGGGAAAQRRLNYQMAMSKLGSDGFGNTTPDVTQPTSPGPSVNSNHKESKKLTKAPTRTVSGSRSIGSGSGGGGSKRKPRSINAKLKSNGDDIDWGTADGDGWPSFDDMNNNKSATDFFVDSDGFFSDNNVFSNDGSVGPTPSTTKTRRKKSDKSVARSADGSTSSGSKKKTHREDRGGSTRKGHRVKKDKDGERAMSDDEREGSTRRSHRLKKEKDKDTLSDDGLGTSRKAHKSKKDKDKDKDKSGRRKTRRASMM